MRFEIAVHSTVELAETPVWDARSGRYSPEKLRQYPDAGSTFLTRRGTPGCPDHFFTIWDTAGKAGKHA